MKPRPSPPKQLRLLRGDGAAGVRRSATPPKPTPGWKARGAPRPGWKNPRAPSVPATLDLTLDEYFAATSLMGLLASQAAEPNQRWCCDWSFKMGQTMAKAARRHRKRT